jgi:hypothetical protein
MERQLRTVIYSRCWRLSSSEKWVHHSSEIQPSYATRRQ